MSTEERLKAFILTKYKSIREFSGTVEMPYSTIDSIFKRGVVNSGVDSIIKICAFLGISVDALIMGEIAPSDTPGQLSPDEQRIGRAWGRATPHEQGIVEKVLEEHLKDEKTGHGSTAM